MVKIKQDLIERFTDLWIAKYQKIAYNRARRVSGWWEVGDLVNEVYAVACENVNKHYDPQRGNFEIVVNFQIRFAFYNILRRPGWRGDRRNKSRRAREVRDADVSFERGHDEKIYAISEAKPPLDRLIEKESVELLRSTIPQCGVCPYIKKTAMLLLDGKSREEMAEIFGLSKHIIYRYVGEANALLYQVGHSLGIG